ncbi:MAG TPA: DUF4149 domain-containing protein [Povalibacter sp.]|nr:DUF4149 domain-containing protein [Povalibacter sp.]
MNSSPVIARVASLLIALWAGSLWTVCGIVAPVLFATLERGVAGQLAGRFFLLQAWIGALIGGLLFVLNRAGKFQLPAQSLVWMAAILPLASHVLLRPLMDRARASGDMARFGLLHTAASACFLFACIALVVIVWKLNRRAE